MSLHLYPTPKNTKDAYDNFMHAAQQSYDPTKVSTSNYYTAADDDKYNAFLRSKVGLSYDERKLQIKARMIADPRIVQLEHNDIIKHMYAYAHQVYKQVGEFQYKIAGISTESSADKSKHIYQEMINEMKRVVDDLYGNIDTSHNISTPQTPIATPQTDFATEADVTKHLAGHHFGSKFKPLEVNNNGKKTWTFTEK